MISLRDKEKPVLDPSFRVRIPGATGDGGGMEYFLQQLINGLTLGSIYGLIAIGYTMVYGIIGMINFAHGDIFMVGAFLALIALILARRHRGDAVPDPASLALDRRAPRRDAAAPRSGAGRSSASPTGRSAARSAWRR